MMDTAMDAITEDYSSIARDIEDLTRQLEVAMMEMDAEARGVISDSDEAQNYMTTPYNRARAAMDDLHSLTMVIGGAFGDDQHVPVTFNARYEPEPAETERTH
jgi:Mg2+ and Co2+ transporter CorA